MGSEDFSFMLEERPGAYIFMGNGDLPGCTTRPMSSTTRRRSVAHSIGASLVEIAMPQRAG